MLSEEIRNLALWMRTRRKYRSMIGMPVDAGGDAIVANVLDEMAEQAERLEAGTRLMSGEECAERIALEAYQPR